MITFLIYFAFGVVSGGIIGSWLMYKSMIETSLRTCKDLANFYNKYLTENQMLSIAKDLEKWVKEKREQG